MDLRITCVTKGDSQLAHERITAVGGADEKGVPWRFSAAEAIDGIMIGRWRMYAYIGGHSYWVIVAISALGERYLKTDHDPEQPINLLSLRGCPPVAAAG